MSISGETPRENLDVNRGRPCRLPSHCGRRRPCAARPCPFHGSDRQRSLRVQVHSGRFVCFACGAWGYMDTARAQWREEQQRQAALQRPPAYRQRVPHRRQPPPRFPDSQWQQPGNADRSTDTACACSSTSRPGPAARRLPGCPARQPRRSVPAAARYSPDPGAAARCGLCGAGHLAACRPGLARRPRGLSAYDAGRAPGEPLRSCRGDRRAGPESEAA